MRTAFSVFLLHCYLGAGDEVLIGKGEDGSALLPHSSTDAAATSNLGQGFRSCSLPTRHEPAERRNE